MEKILKKQKIVVQAGYAMLELLFYISFFAIFCLVVINAMLTMAASFGETAIYSKMHRAGTIMERMSREIRAAGGIASVASGSIEINTTDDLGADKTVKFLLSGSNIELLEDGDVIGNLNTQNITVTDLSFTQIDTAQGKAVRIILTIGVTGDALGRSVDFFDTVVLRG